MSASAYAVVWPRGKRAVTYLSYARHLSSLEGKTIAELSDRDFHADEIFPLLEVELKKRYTGIKFVSYQTFGNIHGDEETRVIASLADNLKSNHCDAVIAGMGC
jgi:hypothetical protein